jgi:hypothetical protein
MKLVDISETKTEYLNGKINEDKANSNSKYSAFRKPLYKVWNSSNI